MKNGLVLLIAVASAACASSGKNVAPLRGVAPLHDLSYESVEFPPYDQSIWRRQRSGRVATAAAATAHTPSAPETPALLAEINRLDDALRSLEELISRNPERIAKAFELLTPEFRRFNDQVHLERRDRLQQIVISARRQAEKLPREEAARAIYHVLFAEAMFFRGGTPFQTELEGQRQTFMEKYRGTEAARILEVDMMSRRGDIQTEIVNLKKFAADHPGTTAAAKALFQAGFQLAVNVGTSGRMPKGTDPTDRILQVIEVMKELESGRYPACEWVQRAPSLVTQFFASEPSYAPHNIDTLLAAYQTVLDGHLNPISPEDVNVAVGILTRMAALYRLKGVENAIDTVFDNLDRRPGQAGVGGYLKAMVYIRPMNDQRRDEKSALLQKVQEALIKVPENGNRIYHRRSLAILASLYFAERDFAKARDAYRRYLQRYPESPWSWVAALRLGQSLDQLGEARAAVDVYRQVAVTQANHAVARTLGRVHAARSLESLSRFDEALVEYERALHGWDPDFGPSYSLSMGFPGIPRELMMDDLRKEQLQLRVAQLQGSLNAGNDGLLERGRWLLDRGRPREALVPLEEMLRSSRDPRTAGEARELIHRARLRRALDWMAAAPNPDVPAALAELDLIARDEPDAVTVAAKVAKASILWRQNASSEAEMLMQEALGEWQSHQSPIAGPVPAIGRDVIAIRNLLFQFDNEPIYGRWAGSRNGRRRSSTVPFIVVNPDVRVRLVDGTERVYSISEGLAVKERVLFLTGSALSLLRDIHTRLEGEYLSKPSRVQQFWSRFFPVGVSMGATLVLQSDPIITDIEFLDAAGTRAAARVAIGHEGTTVILEKNDAGIWKAVRLTSTWIA